MKAHALEALGRGGMKARTLVVSVALCLVPAVWLAPAGAETASTQSEYFYSMNGEQVFNVPAGVRSVDVVAVGAPGAQGAYSSPAGQGARVTGTISVTPGEQLFVHVGHRASGTTGGYPDGGSGGTGYDCDGNGGGGGGSSDVRHWSERNFLPEESASSRVVVAAGGGGGGGGLTPKTWDSYSGHYTGIWGGGGGSASSVTGGYGEDGADAGGYYNDGVGGAPGASSDWDGLNGANGTSDPGLCSAGGGGGGGGLKGGHGGYPGLPGSVSESSIPAGGGGGGGSGSSLVPAGGTIAADPYLSPFVKITWAPAAVDGTPPVASLTAPTAAWDLGSSTTVKWTGSDSGGSGLAKFQVRYRRAPYNGGFGVWAYPASWQTLSASTTQLTSGLAAGYTYCYSVRAFDTAGNASAWSVQRCTRSPLDDRSLTRSSGWTAGTSSYAYKGTILKATVKGSYLARSGSQVARVALVATRCPTCGTVAVKVGSTTIGNVNLYSSTTKMKQVIALPAFSLRSGTVAVIVTSSAKPVFIDGLGISRM